MQPAIRVENLSKQYRLGTRQGVPYQTLRESVSAAATRSWHRATRLARPETTVVPATSTDVKKSGDFWALKDVSFDVQMGEVVGIIGRNGAGKSTLLKVLSRITEPTSGRAEFRGRIGSLLEVGTGFHPELTGRENIYLNGSILGMSRSEISRQFDEIVAFSEIEDFLDTPVKRYSSGMYVRLAFAVAAHLEPEIIVVDEVLAVGDIAFQKKCLGKMGDVARGGRTVLFVSHNMVALRQLCTRGILLEGGELVFSGGVDETLDYYLARAQRQQTGAGFHLRHSSDQINLTEVSVDSDLLKSGEPIALETVWQVTEPVQVAFEVVIRNELLGAVALFASGTMLGNEYRLSPGIHRVKFTFPSLPLAEGTYRFDVMAAHTNRKFLVYAEETIAFTITECDPSGTGFRYHQRHGSVFIPCQIETPASEVRIVLDRDAPKSRKGASKQGA